MVKVLIATFSQTGTTKKVADRIAKGLSSSDCEVTHFSIARDELPDLDGFDVVGIGTPAYFFSPPSIVRDFVQNLKGFDDKSSFVFVLHGTHLGACGNWIRLKLKTKGFKDIGYFTSYGADYWLGYIKRGVLFSPDSPTEAELSSAEDFGKQIAARLSGQNQNIEPFDPSTPFMYRIERTVASRLFVKLIYSKAFRADSKCDNCGICIKKCPMNNISEKNNGKLKWDSKCLLCATCELSCPKDAIHSAIDWTVFAPFMIYNIRKSKNKQIPFVKVEHIGGKTRLI